MTSAQAMELVRTVVLGPKQRRMALCLAQHFGQWVPTETLITAVYIEPDGDPEDVKACIKVMGTYLRQRLAQHGLRIEGQAYLGRRMIWADWTGLRK